LLDFAALLSALLAVTIRKRRILSTLAEKCESVTIAAAERQTKSEKRLLSDQWDSFTLAEFLEIASRDELKKISLARQGRQPVTY
jgi:hypothetical protein